MKKPPFGGREGNMLTAGERLPGVLFLVLVIVALMKLLSWVGGPH